jgi:5-oxoprolinase (ATP-hydrolysing)
MTTVHLHPFSGLLSAYGMGLASIYASRHEGVRASRWPTDSRSSLDALIDDLSDQVQVFEELKQTRASPMRRHHLVAPCCTCATRAPTPRSTVDFSARDMAAIRTAFEAEHKAQFGFVYPENAPSSSKAWSSRRRRHGPPGRRDGASPKRARPGEIPDGETDPHLHRWQMARCSAIVRRDRYQPAANRLKGPAILVEDHQTVVIEPGWQAQP